MYFVLFFTIMLLFTSIPILLFGKQQRINDAQNELDKMMNLQQLFINHWFEDNLMNVQALTHLPAVINQDLERMETIFYEFEENYPKFDSIVFANEDGVAILSGSGSQKIDISEREYFQQAKKGMPYVSDLLIGKQSKEPLVFVSSPILDGEDFKGVVFGSIHLDTIIQIMVQFQDNTGETYIIDDDGMLITPSTQGKIGDHIDTAIFQNVSRQEKMNSFYQNANKEDVIGDYRSVNNGKWFIIGEKKESEIYRPFYQLILIFLVDFLILVTLGYFMISLFSNRIEKPVHQVLQATRAIGRGQWGYRLDSSHVNIDEFKELGNNFNEMAGLIEEYIFTIAKNEERFRLIAEHSSDVITVLNASGLFTYISPAGKDILGFASNEVIGQHVFHFIHEEDIETIQECYQQLFIEKFYVITYRVKRSDGTYIWFESSLRRLKTKQTNEDKIYVISRNITERKMMEEKLKEANIFLQDLSAKDGLTQVWNRRSFNEELTEKWFIATAQHQTLSLIMFDVDFFKQFNDTYGHIAGDHCLQKVAKTVHELVSAFGFKLFRYGGEEFTILLHKASANAAAELAEQVRQAVEHLQIPHEASHTHEVVTVSCGLYTCLPTDEKTLEQFIQQADHMLYEAKEAGRNCVRSKNDTSADKNDCTP